jgi:hypothetical protein
MAPEMNAGLLAIPNRTTKQFLESKRQQSITG